MKKILLLLLSVSAVLAIAGCGGGSHSSSNSSSTSTAGGNTIASPASNVATLVVDAGPAGLSFTDDNVAFVTLQVCIPGSAAGSGNCQTIDHIMVDTGSTGLRIPYEVFNSTLKAGLKNVNGSGSPLAECVQFLDNSFFWGSVRMADIYIGGTSNSGEAAPAIPIQVMGDSALEPPTSAIPADCSGTEEDSVATAGVNGLLGVAVYQYDCEFGNTNYCTSPQTVPPATYYTCSSGTCSNSGLSVPLANQLRNISGAMSKDNNGVIVEMPEVPIGGVSTVTNGALVFGIGTESNNGLTSGAAVLSVDQNVNDPQVGGFVTVYNNVSYPNASEASLLSSSGGTIGSFVDSGSTNLFFLDQPLTGIPDCLYQGTLEQFYCPTNGSGTYSTLSLTATNQANGTSSKVAFNVSNANDLNGAFTAFSDLAGPASTNTSADSVDEAGDGYFDWGLPFFYGRNVYVGMEGVSEPSGVTLPSGPYWAY